MDNCDCDVGGASRCLLCPRNILQFFNVSKLHRTYPFYFAESLDKVGGLIVCFLAVWLMRRTGFRGICLELGLSKTTMTAIGFEVGVSLPMLVGFAMTRQLTPHIDLLAFSSCVFLTHRRGD